MLNHYLTVCTHFKERKCPSQELLEKFCIVPQLATIAGIKKICRDQYCANEVIYFGQTDKVLSFLQLGEY